MLFGSNLGGSRVYSSNLRLRLLLIFAGGLIAFGAIVYWRSQLFLSQDAVILPDKTAQDRRELIRAPAASQTERLKKELNE